MKNTVKSFSSLCFFREPQEDLFFFLGFMRMRKHFFITLDAINLKKHKVRDLLRVRLKNRKKKKFSLNPCKQTQTLDHPNSPKMRVEAIVNKKQTFFFPSVLLLDESQK